MGVFNSSREEAKTFKGLHLYHTSHSNCSARVRLFIEEKQLPWVSHYIDLSAKENISEAYFSLNPKGVVPTIVNDGVVVVESNDILLFLEDAFPKPSFTPKAAEELRAMHLWLQRSADIHVPGIKTFAYAKRNAKLAPKSAKEVQRYRSLQTDPELLAFHAKHDLPGNRISDDDVNDATELVRATLREMDRDIARDGWLAGPAYSLADISWATSITTLRRAGFILEEFNYILDWHARISKRDAWNRAIQMWNGRPTESVMEMPVRKKSEFLEREDAYRYGGTTNLDVG
jgi:glutathione S-transferase